MTASASNSTLFGFGSASNIPLAFLTNNNERARITADGFVGIRTSSPAGFLHVAPGNAATSGAGAPIILQAQQGSTSNSGGNILIGSGQNGPGSTNGYIAFGIGSATSGSAFTSGEAVRITPDSNVGIGTSSPGQKLDVVGNARFYLDAGNVNVSINRQGNGIFNPSLTLWSAYSATNVSQEWSIDTNGCRYSYLNLLRFMDSGASNTERMRIDTTGNLGIGTTSPVARLTVSGTAGNNNALMSVNGSDFVRMYADSAFGSAINWSSGDALRFATSDSSFGSFTERARLTSTGQFLVGTATSYDSVFTTSATGGYSSGNVNAIFVNPTGRGTVRIRSEASDACELFFDTGGGVAWDISCRSVSEGKQMLWFPSAATPSFGNVGSQVMTLTQAGNLTIVGALAKGSGSFQIDHPLPSLNETHHLVHSFVEAPQADLYYRGKVALVGGRATVNIDQVAGMTEGTFVLLNREVQCFTSNESDWDAVRGSVSGNILTIECQNPASTATISWMVVGERQDKHMYDTDWTDENGKVIVEPVKPPPIEPPTFNR
jgi:hypothetical protein